MLAERHAMRPGPGFDDQCVSLLGLLAHSYVFSAALAVYVQGGIVGLRQPLRQ